MEDVLVADRSCGACNVCCVVLTIDTPTLQKLPGHVCRHNQADGLCSIYAARPSPCRTFFCGWRRLKWVGQGLRPDVSGVLIRVQREIGTDQGAISFFLLRRNALRAAGLAEAVAATIHAGVTAYLDLPGPPGHAVIRVRLNERLAPLVARRDKAGLLATLKQIRAEQSMVPHNPIVLANHDRGAAPAQEA